LAAVLLGGGPAVCAQQLAVRHYDVRDGLVHNRVGTIHQDAKGYLWFGTWEGLSRFDGYRFTNYSTRDGLSHPIINDIAEDRQGRLWVGMNGGGIARLIDDPQESGVSGQWQKTQDPRPKTQDQRQSAIRNPQSAIPGATKPKFVSFPVGDSPDSNRVNALLFDADNTLWCATDGGLYRAAADQSGHLTFEVAVVVEPVVASMAALADRHERLWFGMFDELIEIVHGRVIKHGSANEVGQHYITSIVEDRQGRLFVAYDRGVFEFVAPPDPLSRGRWQRLPLTLRPDQTIPSMVADSTGVLWVGTNQGLIKYQEGRQTVYTTAHGLSDNPIAALEEDREGNLWVGTPGGGVCKLSNRMIISFTTAEGLPDHNVHKIVEDRQGRIYASTGQGGVVEIVEGKAVPVPGSQAPPFNTIQKRILQDRRGDWWISTSEGVFRFPGPRLQLRHGRKLPIKNAYPILHEDPAGMMWISSGDGNLYRCDPARSGRLVLERILLGTGVPLVAMMSDRSRALWVAAHGSLWRLVQGKLNRFEPTAGLPEVQPRAFFQDRRGWLWIGLRYKGVSMTKDPTAEHPTFVNYSTEHGLASDTVWSITEDDVGRIYLGTGKGLDQLDPTTGRIRHFTTADGLPSNWIDDCRTDHHGNIWVATSQGLSRLNPRAERRVERPPPIYLSRVQVGGQDLALPETGAQRLPALTLPASQNNVRIEYVGLSFQGEQALQYEYQLEGVDANWTPPTEERSVNYASLSPGTYRFLVRAVSPDGIASPTPATVAFTILPPVWQRWWFLTLVALFLAGVATMIYRYRVARLLELERVRTRIATDLHDDIGSGLTQVSILSEVTKRDAPPPVVEALNEVATLARTMQDSMSDIVWTVDPRKDRLADVVQRMRQTAFNLLEAEGLRVEFHVPADEEIERIGLAADRRRHLLLIFKEAVTNIARHAQANHVRVEMGIEKRAIRLVISDDGQGFDPQARSDGHGLQSLRQRAAELQGTLEIESAPGRGTTVQVIAPIK
jgi:ligand-binding sensor domain-containing protein/two-component sensor histidine kinase